MGKKIIIRIWNTIHFCLLMETNLNSFRNWTKERTRIYEIYKAEIKTDILYQSHAVGCNKVQVSLIFDL